jgi:hypothetical protein
MDKKLGILLASVLPLALLGALKVPPLPVPNGAVEIFNSGNSDFAGFRIVVDRSGKAWSIDGAGRGRAVLQQNVVDALFSDVTAAKPLRALPTQSCATNATDASTAAMAANAAIMVIAGGERSPDLRCSNDPRAAALLADAQTIQRALYVQAYRVRPGIMMFGGGSAIGGSQPPPPPPSGGMGTGYP